MTITKHIGGGNNDYANIDAAFTDLNITSNITDDTVLLLFEDQITPNQVTVALNDGFDFNNKSLTITSNNDTLRQISVLVDSSPRFIRANNIINGNSINISKIHFLGGTVYVTGPVTWNYDRCRCEDIEFNWRVIRVNADQVVNVTNCVFRGIAAFELAGGSLNAYNNTFYGNHGSDKLWQESATGNLNDICAMTIKNNIFYNTSSVDSLFFVGRYDLQYLANQTYENNIYYGSSGIFAYRTESTIYTGFDNWKTLTGDNSVFINPLFVNSPDDLSLASGSPAIDTGVTGLNTHDFINNTRPQGVGYDIGAYEFMLTVYEIGAGKTYANFDAAMVAFNADSPQQSDIVFKLYENQTGANIVTASMLNHDFNNKSVYIISSDNTARTIEIANSYVGGQARFLIGDGCSNGTVLGFTSLDIVGVTYFNSHINYVVDKCLLGRDAGDLNGIGVNNDSTLTITNSVIENARLYATSVGTITAYNNTFYGTYDSSNPWHQATITDIGGANTIVLKNNIFYNTSANDSIFFVTQTDVNQFASWALENNSYYGSNGVFAYITQYNVYTGISDWVTLTGDNSTFANPLFVNAPTDLSLASGSPAIDAGVTGLNAHDFANSLRPQGSGYDIGAYEANLSTQCARPTFLPIEGTYNNTQNVTISTTTSSATIYYTTNGDTPDSNSTPYISIPNTPVEVATSQTLKAIAIDGILDDSEIGQADYIIQCATPVITPPTGSYDAIQTVHIDCDTTGAIKRYTTTGLDPDGSSDIFTTDFDVSVTTTVKAKAFKTDYEDSDIDTSVISIDLLAPTPMKLTVVTVSNNKEVSIALHGTLTDVVIDWDDGTPTNVGSTPGAYSKTYAVAGTYYVEISGTFTGYGWESNGSGSGTETITAVTDWGDNIETLTSLFGAFVDHSALTSVPTLPVGNIVNNMSYMFRNAPVFNQDISGWDVSAVTDMSNMFQFADAFNRDISDWDVSAVTDMSHMFESITHFNNGGQVLDWGNKVSLVNNMSYMFCNAPVFNQDISDWNVSAVTDMSNMFQNATAFNNGGQALDWGNKVALVNNMSSMFLESRAFNQDISDWDVSAVTDMSYMFQTATAFNNGGQALDWGNKVALVNNMSSMFLESRVFNQDISGWDVSAVTDMSYMFTGAWVFNNGGQALDWGNKVSLVNNMEGTFKGADTFNQDISDWDVSAVTNMSYMFQSADAFSTTNYDLLLAAWSQLTVQTGVIFDMNSTTKYTVAGELGRDILTGSPNNWTIYDGGLEASTQCETPTFLPVEGSYGSVQNVQILCPSATSIFYTDDGTDPTAISTPYTIPIDISVTTTIKAIGMKSGYINSSIATALYEILYCEDPVFSILSGTYNIGQNLTLTCATIGSEIYYTDDGSVPTTGSNLYASPIVIDGTQTIKAITVASGYIDSNVVEETYEFECSSVVFSPIAGTYTSSQEIELLCGTPSVEIYYTDDNSVPTTGSNLYVNPIPLSTTTTLKAIAVKSNYNDSGVSTGLFEINLPTVNTPEFSPVAGTYEGMQTVTITCGTLGVEIYYTDDDSTPTTGSTLYVNPIVIDNTTTLKAIAVKYDYLDSNIGIAVYNMKVVDPIFSPDAGKYSNVFDVEITCLTKNSKVYYTLDGSNPTEESTEYITPILIDEMTVIKAIGVAQDHTDSDIISATYIIEDSTVKKFPQSNPLSIVIEKE